MSDFIQGNLVLLPIPFTDLTTSKKRPAIIITNSKFITGRQDLNVVAVTSALHNATQHTLHFFQDDMVTGYLKKESLIQCDKIFTIKKDIIIKTFGTVNDLKLRDIWRNIKKLE